MQQMETMVVKDGIHTQCSRSSAVQIMEEIAIFCLATHHAPCVDEGNVKSWKPHQMAGCPVGSNQWGISYIAKQLR